MRSPLSRLPGDVPPEVRTAVREMWDGLTADIRQLVRDGHITDLRRPANLRRLLDLLSARLDEFQRVLIVLGTRYPAPGDSDRRQVLTAAAISGAATGAEQAVTYASLGTAAVAAVSAALVSELVDVYLAASARTRQYMRAGYQPTPDHIARDLSAALSTESVVERGTSRQATIEALRALARRLVRRSFSRIAKGLMVVVGVGWAATSSARSLRRVLAQPLRPPVPEIDPVLGATQ